MTRRLISKHPNLLSIDEAAAYLGMGRTSVYELMRHEPPLPSFLVLGSRRFWKDEIDAWLLSLPRDTGDPHKRGPKPVDLAARKAG